MKNKRQNSYKNNIKFVSVIIISLSQSYNKNNFAVLVEPKNKFEKYYIKGPNLLTSLYKRISTYQSIILILFIILFKLSVSVCPKVITLSIFTVIIPTLQQKILDFPNFISRLDFKKFKNCIPWKKYLSI